MSFELWLEEKVLGSRWDWNATYSLAILLLITIIFIIYIKVLSN